MSNSYLQYTSKDYDSIYKDLTDSISGISDIWTSREDSDPGIVLVKLMSALGDMLSYNMDKQSLEYYGPTVTQRKNAAKLFNLIGYRMHWYKSAKTLLTLKNTTIVPTQINFYIRYNNAESTEGKTLIYEEYINTYTNETYESESKWYQSIQTRYNSWSSVNVLEIHRFLDDPSRTLNVSSKGNNRLYYTIEPTTTSPGLINNSTSYNPTERIFPGEQVSFNAIQGYLCSVEFNESQLKNNKFYLPESTLDENYIYLKCVNSGSNSGVTYFTKVDNLLLQTDGGLHFEFKIDDFDCPYIELSSYWKDLYGEDAVSFSLSYIRTSGKYGNVTKNYLDYVSGMDLRKLTISHSANSSYLQDSNGTTICSPGFNPQSAQDAYVDALNYIMTFDTVVTIYDFERFTKRQDGISNTYAIDGQRAMDLNDKLMDSCSNLSTIQLQKLLNNYQSSKESMIEELYRRRSVHYNFWEDSSPYSKYKNYGLNIHVVYGNFETTNSEGTVIAKYSKDWKNPLSLQSIKTFPYYMYGINNDLLNGTSGDDLSIQNELNEALDKCRIVNVKPEYTVVRVFPWRCCGTIYLIKPVTSEVSEKLIQTIITNLSNAFHPRNLIFGEKITYMSVIEVITASSNLIRYFDAGMGSNKLIDLEDTAGDGSTESYFNDYSLMHYVQTYDENNTEFNEDSTLNPYYHQLVISPEYIL